MKALTVRQPFASAILRGVKDVENRTWSTRHRGELVIHAASKFQRRLIPGTWPEDELVPTEGECATGVLLGVVTLVDVVAGYESPWSVAGHFQWVLANPRWFTDFEPVTGRLGLWSVPDPVRSLMRSKSLSRNLIDLSDSTRERGSVST